MKTARWRCYWRWPLGHRWEHVVVDPRHAYKRCADCGKSKGRYTGPPASADRDYGGYGGDAGGGD